MADQDSFQKPSQVLHTVVGILFRFSKISSFNSSINIFRHGLQPGYAFTSLVTKPASAFMNCLQQSGRRTVPRRSLDSDCYRYRRRHNHHKEGLIRLSGIGKKLAQRIIQNRPFVHIDDLNQIRELRKEKIYWILYFVSIQ